VQKKIMQIYGLDKKPQYNDSADALGMAWLGNIVK
jgi:Holliday junction resolvasome RuvABC endonuclease subunit